MFLCLARYSGATIHFVDEHYDTGRILAQRIVPVLANDTAEELAARVLREVIILYHILVSICENSHVFYFASAFLLLSFYSQRVAKRNIKMSMTFTITKLL